MGVAAAGERSLLNESEFDMVTRSHYPSLTGATRPELVDLARLLREQHSRSQDIIRRRRRVRRGKAEPRSGADLQASERGLSAKKQVFARALKRVNNRLDHLSTVERQEQALGNLRAALERKRDARSNRPDPGRTANEGMRAVENPKNTVDTDPREIGRVSQFVRDAQARRDG